MRTFIPLLVIAAGCSPEGPPTMLDEVTVLAKGPPGAGTVRFHVAGGATPTEADVTVAVTQVAIALDLKRDHGTITRFEAPFEDIRIPDGAAPPGGLTLRSPALGLMTPVRAEIMWRAADLASLRVRAPLLVSATLEHGDGSQFEVGPVFTALVMIYFDVLRDAAGATSLAVRASCHEGCMALPQVMIIDDANVAIEAPATVSYLGE
jgi:hypothetical protein